MSGRTLGVVQVAAMLVSASYGIGFLFGSGEMAMAHGMAGSLYGVVTAAGMLVLATIAQRLWRAGVPIWDLFGQAYGARVQRWVALLSLLWMGGVLAAQIHGGVAVMRLLGLPGPGALMLVLGLIFGASRMELRLASRVFALCLLASAAVLVVALVHTDGLALYAHALPAFAEDLDTFSPTHLLAITLAVGLMVCTGSDYHQFVLAARRPTAAVLGCVLAALVLCLVGFMPAAVVLAAQQSAQLPVALDAKGVVPWVLARAAGALGDGGAQAMLLALSTAALGSGAAILRAMSSALASAFVVRPSVDHPLLGLAALAVGAVVAGRGQGIVETMVSIDVVYLASVGVCFSALLRRTAMAPTQAVAVMASGLVGSLSVYLLTWAGWHPVEADTVSLLCGLTASGLTSAFVARAAPAGPAGAPGP